MVAVIEVVGLVAVVLLAFLWLRGTSLYMAHRRHGIHPSRPVIGDREKLIDHRGRFFRAGYFEPLPDRKKRD